MTSGCKGGEVGGGDGGCEQGNITAEARQAQSKVVGHVPGKGEIKTLGMAKTE